MTTNEPIRAVFFDVGGVLLTNGWDHEMRGRAAQRFRLDADEMSERHHLTFDTYEVGKLSLDEYLNRVVFYQPRAFTRDEFKSFMFAQSQPYQDMLELVRTLRSANDVRIGVVSNEGRELMEHRIRTFRLVDYVDFFVVSAFVHFRKPDADIFWVALDTAQIPAGQIAYVEDREMFVDVANTLGIRGIHHVGVDSTAKALAEMGLVVA